MRNIAIIMMVLGGGQIGHFLPLGGAMAPFAPPWIRQCVPPALSIQEQVKALTQVDN